MTPRKPIIALLLITLITGALATSASANSRQEYAKQVEVFRAKLLEQSEADAGKLAADDIALVSTWLKEAQALLGSGDVDRAGYKLKRVEYGIDLIQALVGASKIKDAATQQTLAYEKSLAQIEKLKAETAKLQEQKAQLERDLRAAR